MSRDCSPVAPKRRATPRVKRKPDRFTIGWREWVDLPDLGIHSIKAKVDTGARSSALHAKNVSVFDRDGVKWVKFTVYPQQRARTPRITTAAPLLEYRNVRDSGGRVTKRPVIRINVILGGHTWPIELTLVNRSAMGFRMLLGRQAVRRRCLIDAGGSFLAGPAKEARQEGIQPGTVPDAGQAGEASDSEPSNQPNPTDQAAAAGQAGERAEPAAGAAGSNGDAKAAPSTDPPLTAGPKRADPGANRDPTEPVKKKRKGKRAPAEGKATVPPTLHDSSKTIRRRKNPLETEEP